jgi:spore germination protein YaaH
MSQGLAAAPIKRLSAKKHPKPATTTLMYMVNRPASIESFREHSKQISIIAPQCFTMDAQGFVAGEVPPEVLEIARKNKVALMPLVTNRGFKQDLMHTVLDTPESRARAIRYLLYYALRDGYIGFQFDYENIKYFYRDRFTTFFHEAATEFHRHGLLLSAAVVGKYADDRNSKSPGGFDDWSGVYDYKALGKDADFLSIMAYAEHAGYSDPGPIAGVPWVKQIVDFTVANIPPRKVSLGVPTYGTRWIAVAPETIVKADFVQDNAGPRVKKWRVTSAAWPLAIPELLKTNKAVWDETEQAHHFAFTDDKGVNNEVWYEDASSLKPKMDMAAQYKLGWGISAWVLGTEDPTFWTMVEQNYSVKHPKTPVVKSTYEQRTKTAATRLHVNTAAILNKAATGK